jgi:hypothetical protein
MLPELLQFDVAGSLEEFQFLFDRVRGYEARENDLREVAIAHSVEYARNVSSSLLLLELLGIITRQEGVFKAGDVADLRVEIISRVLNLLEDQNILLKVFSIEGLAYEPNEDKLYLKNSFIPVKYSYIKSLFLNLGILVRVSDLNYEVASSQRDFFERALLKRMKSVHENSFNSLTLEQLRRMQFMQQLKGEQAESFVVQFEIRRLGKECAVKKVSDFDVAAGFDIASFDTLSSVEHDRFIEVKSFDSGRFFWTKNEIETAKAKKDSYHLYLVEVSKISQDGYSPMMISNPYDKVFLKDDWSREVQDWVFFPKT